MAIYSKNSKCIICNKIIGEAEKPITFPAFIPKAHVFSTFSDGVFHKDCFDAWGDHEQFARLYEDYKRIWESSPSGVSFEEAEEWGKQAFKTIFQKG